MRLRTIACALTTALLLALSIGSAAATPAPRHLQKLAQQQTNLALKFYNGKQNVSPPKCGQGQGSDGIHGVFLLPVPFLDPGDQTVNCKTRARKVLVDLGGVVLTEDKIKTNTYELLSGEVVRFKRKNLERICDDLIERDFQPVFAKNKVPVPATLDGRRITGPRKPLNSGVFTAKVSRKAPQYADSKALGHPGRLATVYCGFKAKVHLRPGTHRIVVNYSGILSNSDNPSTEFTYKIKVKADHRSH